ncbi:hypothetical protein DPX16_18800 [Anabarilius grahami]|uniref:Methyltransferase domain-containing protein n=1 Tax=Anabarilius grahami TaxID=495550 RepID=A0A3N0Y388_ANAGA|nr:hypothetical protein DPX16_18800 [Anabarilius grahami]
MGKRKDLSEFDKGQIVMARRLGQSICTCGVFSVCCEMLSDKVGKQLGHPTYSLTGWLVSKFFKWYNQILEENAVKLSNIQPNDTVLELGHGPGLGLQVASQLLTGPRGKLIGVDYSQYMHQMASERMKEQISRGKAVLYCSDLVAMPIEENTVDKRRERVKMDAEQTVTELVARKNATSVIWRYFGYKIINPD